MRVSISREKRAKFFVCSHMFGSIEEQRAREGLAETGPWGPLDGTVCVPLAFGFQRGSMTKQMKTGDGRDADGWHASDDGAGKPRPRRSRLPPAQTKDDGDPPEEWCDRYRGQRRHERFRQAFDEAPRRTAHKAPVESATAREIRELKEMPRQRSRRRSIHW